MGRVLLVVAGVLAMAGAASAADKSENQVVVFAAASLREAFTRIAERFEGDHGGARAVLNLAGSQDLAMQIEQGAEADVFASADAVQMSRLERGGLVAAPRIFAANEPVIVLAPGNPATITALKDLPKAPRIVVGAPEVPIGRYTRQILDRAVRLYGADFRRRVEERVVSNELNVRQVLAKVALGEADAGIVYRTDVAAARDRLQLVKIPDEVNVIAEYPIARTAKPPHPMLAEAWIELVTSAIGRCILADSGFTRVDGAARTPRP